ncbi:ADP-ribosylglycohydrolase family protein [Actinomadura vinacea]|uniref:ADP-ribosylglycohydrolase family protein n=1 Tax=Actinomadura vinacea TaxID=115336 RepID=A0ABP5WGY2_9ACTN
MTDRTRLALAIDALTGLSVGDAVGNQAFPPHLRVRAPIHPPEVWSWTDDTQMACSLLDVLDRHGTVDQNALAKAFAAHAETFRDYGMGALQFIDHVLHGGGWRAINAKLFDGAGSWGNGGAMRVAPLGAYFHDDLRKAAAEGAASAEVTHAHPEGIAGGVAIAVAAAHVTAHRGRAVPDLFETVLAHTPAGDVHDGIRRAGELRDRPASEVADEVGNGSRISAPDTVPFALWTIGEHLDDYETAIRTCTLVGGDMDTMAAIVGGVIAAHHGALCVPTEWLEAREPLPRWFTL